MTTPDFGTPPSGGPQASWGSPPTLAGRTVSPALGLLGAVALALLGAAVWALILDYAHSTFSLISVLLGSLTGALLCMSLGRKPLSGVIAAVLTVGACLLGEVVGIWAYETRTAGVPFSAVRRAVPAGDVLHHMAGLTYLFLAVGAFIAFRAGTGQRNALGGRRRRRL